MRSIMTLIVAASALGVAGCSEVGTDGVDTTPVPGNYLVRAVNEVPMPEGVTFNLGVDGTFSGHAPCNDYSGTSAIPLPGFEAGTIAVTRKMCDGNAMRHEKAFFDALQRVDSVGEGAGGMTLSNSGQGDTAQNISLRRLPLGEI